MRRYFMLRSNTLFNDNAASKCFGTSITMAMAGTTIGTASIANHFGVDEYASILRMRLIVTMKAHLNLD
jgi:hypothetical protein